VNTRPFPALVKLRFDTHVMRIEQARESAHTPTVEGFLNLAWQRKEPHRDRSHATIVLKRTAVEEKRPPTVTGLLLANLQHENLLSPTLGRA